MRFFGGFFSRFFDSWFGSDTANQGIVVGLATETDSALAATVNKNRIVGLVIETDSALVAAAFQDRPIISYFTLPLPAVKYSTLGLLRQTSAPRSLSRSCPIETLLPTVKYSKLHLPTIRFSSLALLGQTDVAPLPTISRFIKVINDDT